ncbi:MAG: hypothetical protein HC838_06550 [Spirulinaceae cyanobacterium RM2_2_10]|nr:hypothetical protein [Spirulinaceae cyanobacterium RM2_2_10]
MLTSYPLPAVSKLFADIKQDINAMQPNVVERPRARTSGQQDRLGEIMKRQLLAANVPSGLAAAQRQGKDLVAPPDPPRKWQSLSREAAQLASARKKNLVDAMPASSVERTPWETQTSLTAASGRQQCCRHLGEKLRQARCERSLSIDDLASQTYIQTSQIAALEAGDLADPHDDIYLRGFLKRLSPVLQLNAAELLAELPVVSFSPVPSWYEPSLYREPWSMGRYCGYTAMLVGTVIAWVGGFSKYGRLPRCLICSPRRLFASNRRRRRWRRSRLPRSHRRSNCCSSEWVNR